MDMSTIWIIVAVVVIAAIFMFMRSRPAPRGTYDDKHVSSGGSIGGGTRANDDPKVRSGGSIGGAKVYDTPEHKSSGSIGGQSQAARRERVMGNDDDSDNNDGRERPTHNDRGVKSGGSIGPA